MLCMSASAYHQADEEAIINSKAAAGKQSIDAFLQGGSIPPLNCGIFCHKDTHLPACVSLLTIEPKSITNRRAAASAAI